MAFYPPCDNSDFDSLATALDTELIGISADQESGVVPFKTNHIVSANVSEEIGGSAGGNSLPVEAGQQRDHSPRSLDLHEEYTYAYLGQIRRVELTGISSGSVGSHHQKDEKQAFAMDARDELAQRLSQLQRLKKKRVEDFMKKPPPRTAADQKAFEQLLKDVKPIKPKRSTQHPASGGGLGTDSRTQSQRRESSHE
eukprot:m.408154 g.408154  ORF g.408154 m.408154 type:complete len:197 (-) comp21231_c2_seq48:1664-2254(-)